MKATELRLNNLVYFEFDFKLQIHLIIPKDLRLMQKVEQMVKEELELYRPIPLSEEILLKCGFRKSKSGVYLSDKFSFDLSYFEFGVESDYYYLTIAENIKHLHQLQNLYFALTGQELEINL